MIIDDVWKLIYSGSKSLSKTYWLNTHKFISTSEIYSKHTVFITCQILYRYRYGYRYIWAPKVALVVKKTTANAGDIRNMGLIPGLGRSPGGGHDNPLQYSCLENPMDRGAWWATVYRVTKSQTQLKHLSTNHREVKQLAWSHRADAQWNWNWNPSWLTPEPMFVIMTLLCLFCRGTNPNKCHSIVKEKWRKDQIFQSLWKLSWIMPSWKIKITNNKMGEKIPMSRSLLILFGQNESLHSLQFFSPLYFSWNTCQI